MYTLFSFLKRLLRGFLWRLVWLNRVLIYRAPACEASPSAPEGFALVRIKGSSPPADQATVSQVMQEAGEPEELAVLRFEHGDELFGWSCGGRIVCFGWVTQRDRTVGPIRLAEAPGRMFLYNFHTLPDYRGCGLYSALLLAIRHGLGGEQQTEFIIDVNVINTVSASGVKKAGFIQVARITFLTIFRRWSVPVNVVCSCNPYFHSECDRSTVE